VLAVVEQALRMRQLAAIDTVLNVQVASLCLLAGQPHYARHLLQGPVCGVLQQLIQLEMEDAVQEDVVVRATAAVALLALHHRSTPAAPEGLQVGQGYGQG